MLSDISEARCGALGGWRIEELVFWGGGDRSGVKTPSFFCVFSARLNSLLKESFTVLKSKARG